MFCEDFVFYFTHRILHTKYLYKIVHKKHHENYNVIHINCIFTHWFEFVIGNLVALYTGLMVMGAKMHAMNFLIFTVY